MEEKPQYRVQELSFVERKREYGDVYTYIFNSEEPVSYTAGQYGHVRLSGMPEGARAVREYSFSSAPDDPFIEFGIDCRSGSEYQKRLEALKVGDTVGLFKIKSHMTWPSVKPQAVMIAGGVGITPFRSMLRDHKEKRLSLQTAVIHASRSDFLYADEMRELAHTYIQTNREDFEKELLSVIGSHYDAHYYVAGSPAFVEVTLNTLLGKGIVAESDPFKGLEEI